MLRILLSLVFSFLLIASPIFAEGLTPTPKPVASQGQVLGIFDNLFNFLNNLLGEKQVPEKITAVYQRSNPILSADSTASSTGTNVEKATIGYAFAKAGLTPDETPTNRQTFFDKIMSFFNLGLTDSLVVKGNEDAEDFASARLPNNVARQVIAGSQVNSFLAQGDTNVLGASASGQAAVEGLDVALCSNLPLALCPGGNFGGTSPEEPTGSPIPTGPAVTPPTGDLPAVCYERPACNNGVGDCYKDTNLGSCWIYTKGFCSVDCLKPFFGDERTAKIASQICNRESGGNPFVVNEGCLKPDTSKRSKEYSVGLFQINLWPDEYKPYRCPGTLQRQATPPPYYYCEKGPNFDRCRTEFADAKRNIEAAYQLYRARGNKWGDWAAAGPDYCDIK